MRNSCTMKLYAKLERIRANKHRNYRGILFDQRNRGILETEELLEWPTWVLWNTLSPLPMPRLSFSSLYNEILCEIGYSLERFWAEIGVSVEIPKGEKRMQYCNNKVLFVHLVQWRKKANTPPIFLLFYKAILCYWFDKLFLKVLYCYDNIILIKRVICDIFKLININ